MFFIAYAQWCCRWRARRYSVPRQPPPAAQRPPLAAGGQEQANAINFASAAPSKMRGLAEAGEALAEPARPRALLPPVADGSRCHRGRCWYPEPPQSGCLSILRRLPRRQPSTGCVPSSAAGQSICTCMLISPSSRSPLIIAEHHHIPLHGNLFRGHDASPSLRSHRFGNPPWNQ